MPNLPAIVRPIFPRLAHRLEFGKQNAQERDQGSLEVRPRQTLDVELTDSRLTYAERQALKAVIDARVEAAQWKARSEVLERARYEDRSFFREVFDRTHAVYESYNARKHELALGHMKRGNKFVKLKYKLKRAAIKYGTIAAVALALGWIISSQLSHGAPTNSRSHTGFQSAVDR